MYSIDPRSCWIIPHLVFITDSLAVLYPIKETKTKTTRVWKLARKNSFNLSPVVLGIFHCQLSVAILCEMRGGGLVRHNTQEDKVSVGQQYRREPVTTTRQHFQLTVSTRFLASSLTFIQSISM